MQLSTGKRFRLYVETISRFGMFLLELSDQEMWPYIFEEFEGGAISFLYKDNFIFFQGEGLIDARVRRKSEILREKFMLLYERKQWSCAEVRQ